MKRPKPTGYLRPKGKKRAGYIDVPETTEEASALLRVVYEQARCESEDLSTAVWPWLGEVPAVDPAEEREPAVWLEVVEVPAEESEDETLLGDGKTELASGAPMKTDDEQGVLARLEALESEVRELRAQVKALRTEETFRTAQQGSLTTGRTARKLEPWEAQSRRQEEDRERSAAANRARARESEEAA